MLVAPQRPHARPQGRTTAMGIRRTVHVVDRRPLFAQSLAASLTRHGMTATAGPAGPAVDRAEVVVVDADRSPDDVAADVSQVRRRAPAAVVVALSRDGARGPGAQRRLGVDGWVSRSSTVRELADLLGGDLSALRKARRTTPATHGSSALTEREVEILSTLAGGGTTQAAAERLGISQHTVRTHLQNIHSKLGVRSRLAAVAAARGAGVLPVGAVQARSA